MPRKKQLLREKLLFFCEVEKFSTEVDKFATLEPGVKRMLGARDKIFPTFVNWPTKPVKFAVFKDVGQKYEFVVNLQNWRNLVCSS